MAPGEDYSKLRAGVNEVLQDLGNLLGELVDRPGGPVDEDGEDEDAHSIIDTQLNSFFRGFRTLKRRHDDQSLSCAVLALTKSGKSTLINALVGHELMPVNNVPETARICKIVHTPRAHLPGSSHPEPYMEEPGGKRHISDKAIRQRLQELNSLARSTSTTGSISPQSSGALPGSPSSTSTQPTLCGAGGSSSNSGGALDLESILQIHTPIAALQEYDTEDSAKLFLLDTPGPNEAGEEGLRFQVERLLGGVDAVLYLLDYTKLKTAEEAGMFRRLREVNPQLVRRLAQRLFFVVNKVDTMATSEGQGPDETRQYVAELVTRQLQLEGFRLAPEQVVLISARNALLSRLVLSGRASEDSLARFLNLAFGAFGAAMVKRSSGSGAAAAAAAIGQEQVAAAAYAVLEDSGVLDLEQQVLAYLYSHGGAVKMLATVDDISRLLQEVRNVAVLCRSCLQQGVEALQQRASLMRSELQETLCTFDAVMGDSASAADEVAGEVREMLQALRGRLFTQIVRTLDDNVTAGPGEICGVMGAGAPIGRWARVRERFLSIFTSSNASCGTASARSRSRDEMVSLLMDLHEDLLAQIHAEVGEFWSLMEACASSRHRELLARINSRLALLSHQVEAVVSSRLEVPLEPVSLCMAAPSTEEFHSNLQELITKGVGETQEKHIRVGQRQSKERVLRYGDGVCRWGQYWEERPRTRTVVETYTVSVFELKPNEIVSHFVEMVDTAVGNTERALDARVRAHVHRQLEGARERVQEYCDRYLSATTSALEASRRGTEHRAVALQQVERHMEQVQAISSRLAELAAGVEGLVPCLQEASPYDELEEELRELQEEMQQREQEQQGAPAAAAAGLALEEQAGRGADAVVEGGAKEVEEELRELQADMALGQQVREEEAVQQEVPAAEGEAAAAAGAGSMWRWFGRADVPAKAAKQQQVVEEVEMAGGDGAAAAAREAVAVEDVEAAGAMVAMEVAGAQEQAKCNADCQEQEVARDEEARQEEEEEQQEEKQEAAGQEAGSEEASDDDGYDEDEDEDMDDELWELPMKLLRVEGEAEEDEEESSEEDAEVQQQAEDEQQQQQQVSAGTAEKVGVLGLDGDATAATAAAGPQSDYGSCSSSSDLLDLDAATTDEAAAGREQPAAAPEAAAAAAAAETVPALAVMPDEAPEAPAAAPLVSAFGMAAAQDAPVSALVLPASPVVAAAAAGALTPMDSLVASILQQEEAERKLLQAAAAEKLEGSQVEPAEDLAAAEGDAADLDHILTSHDEVPFDYATGFGRAMSTSQMVLSGVLPGARQAPPGSPTCASTDDEWTIVANGEEAA